MSVWSWDSIVPVIDPSAFVHPDATVIGDVIIGPGAYVGAQCVLRGDFGRIVIEEGAQLKGRIVIGTDAESAIDAAVEPGSAKDARKTQAPPKPQAASAKAGETPSSHPLPTSA